MNKSTLCSFSIMIYGFIITFAYIFNDNGKSRIQLQSRVEVGFFFKLKNLCLPKYFIHVYNGRWLISRAQPGFLTTARLPTYGQQLHECIYRRMLMRFAGKMRRENRLIDAMTVPNSSMSTVSFECFEQIFFGKSAQRDSPLVASDSDYVPNTGEGATQSRCRSKHTNECNKEFAETCSPLLRHNPEFLTGSSVGGRFSEALPLLAHK